MQEMAATGTKTEEGPLQLFASEVVDRLFYTETIWSITARHLFLISPAAVVVVAFLMAIGVISLPFTNAWIVGLLLVSGYLLWRVWWGCQLLLIRHEAPTFTFRRTTTEVEGKTEVVGSEFEGATYPLNFLDHTVWRLSGLSTVLVALSIIGITAYNYLS
jgi:hypothetical protein